MTIVEALCILAAGPKQDATHYSANPYHEAECIVRAEAERIREQSDYDALGRMLTPKSVRAIP